MTLQPPPTEHSDGSDPKVQVLRKLKRSSHIERMINIMNEVVPTIVPRGKLKEYLEAVQTT